MVSNVPNVMGHEFFLCHSYAKSGENVRIFAGPSETPIFPTPQKHVPDDDFKCSKEPGNQQVQICF